MKLVEMTQKQDEDLSKEDIRGFLMNLKLEWHNIDYETQKKAVSTIFESITIKVLKKGISGKNPKPAVIEITDYQFR